MKTSKIILAILLVFAGFLSKGQEQLNTYLLQAAENNPGLKSRFNNYLSALEKVPQVNALPDPQVAFGYFIQPVETRNGPQQFRLSATQMFPWFGTLKAKENVAAQAAKVKYELFEEEKSRLFHEVRSAYYNLYFTQKAMAVSEENIGLLKSFLKMALIKVEAGKVSAVDEYRLEMEMADLKNQLALLQDNFNVQRVVFNNLLNTDSNTLIELPDELWENDLEMNKTAILDSIQIQNHQLLKIEMERELEMLKKDLAGLDGKPDFSVGADYFNIGKGDNNLSGKDAFVFPKIGITIPLYRNKYKAMVQEVAYLETAKGFEKENKINQLESLFEMTYKNYADANRRIELYRSQTDLARRSLKILETEYATSNRNFEELLQLERQLLKYNLELEKAKADKQAAVSFISYLMGK